MKPPVVAQRYCRETRASQVRRIFPFDSNGYGTLYGGRLTSWLDEVASISVSRHARADAVTATIDTLQFLQPLKTGDAVCIETFVSGAGTTSIEVFAKVIGEHLLTGERYLAATTFWTFVTLRTSDGEQVEVPRIVPESEEERRVCAGYAVRRQQRAQQRAANQSLAIRT